MTDVADQTPPTLHGPSDKERKYDRQLRLWAASGQAALESSHVLLINSGGGTVGVEALKNLVLPEQIEVIRAYARTHATPLVAIHSVGFYSYFKMDLPYAFPIVDTHPDETATTDLRLLSPWPELSAFASEMTRDIDALDDHDHGHLPLIVILLHYLDLWKQTHDGSFPTAYADKVAFRNLLSDAMRKSNPEGSEENFEEAISAVMKHVTRSSLPSSLQQVFDFRHDAQHGPETSFWTLAQAVQEFYRRHQQLPVPGGLPDMKAESKIYIKLQNLYKDKARRDAAEVLDIARSVSGGLEVDCAEAELFCANAKFIKLVNARKGDGLTMSQIVEEQLANDEMAAVAGPEVPTSLIPIYLALAATSYTASLPADEILAYMTQQAPALGNSGKSVQVANEVSRAAGGELHNISAVTGGMVAQEVIKIVTQQYIPVDNTCIFDGIESRCQVLRL
ncbi:hypothetical protein PLIIFM63780_002805 [Purpureocillium lilacinum]|nr:hypothetical protein PLIIFM63780_002805 [Purpureocillium lilacinum]